jgi:hypothetical protein
MKATYVIQGECEPQDVQLFESIVEDIRGFASVDSAIITILANTEIILA